MQKHDLAYMVGCLFGALAMFATVLTNWWWVSTVLCLAGLCLLNLGLSIFGDKSDNTKGDPPGLTPA